MQHEMHAGNMSKAAAPAAAPALCSDPPQHPVSAGAPVGPNMRCCCCTAMRTAIMPCLCHFSTGRPAPLQAAAGRRAGRQAGMARAWLRQKLCSQPPRPASLPASVPLCPQPAASGSTQQEPPTPHTPTHTHTRLPSLLPHSAGRCSRRPPAGWRPSCCACPTGSPRTGGRPCRGRPSRTAEGEGG